MERKRVSAIWVALLILLLIVMMIPVAAFCYLQFFGFPTEQMREGYDPEAPYAGKAVFSKNGDATVLLKENDLYWMADTLLKEQIDEALPDMATLSGFAVSLREDGLDVYADGKLWGFVPVPVKATLSGAFRNKRLDFTVQEVRLGKAISIPIEKLGKLGMKEFSIELEDAGLTSRVTNVQMNGDGVCVTERFLPELLQKAFLGARNGHRAFAITVYEGQDALRAEPTVALAADPYGENPDAAALCAMAVQAGNPEGTLLSLLALTGSDSSHLLKDLGPFERHFILPVTDGELVDAEAVYLRRVAQGQERYETLLNRLREAYQAMRMTLDASGIIDNATGKPLSLHSLYPPSGIDDSVSRVVLLSSLDALQAVRTADMPTLENVPKTSKNAIAGLYAKLPCDLGILTIMPDGRPALLYDQANGYFIVNFLSGSGGEGLYEDLMKQNGLLHRMSESLPKPPTRVKCESPGEGLSPYSILLLGPEDVYE